MLLQSYLNMNQKPTGRITVAFLFGLIGSIALFVGSLQTFTPWGSCSLPGGGASLEFNLRTCSITISGVSMSGNICDFSFNNSRDGSLCDQTRLTIEICVVAAVVALLSSFIMMGLYCCNNRNCNWVLNMLLMFFVSLAGAAGALNFWLSFDDREPVTMEEKIAYLLCERENGPFAILLIGSIFCLISSFCSCVCCCSAKPKLEQDLAYAQIGMMPQPAYHQPSQGVTNVPASYLPNEQYVPPTMSLNGTPPFNPMPNRAEF